MAITRFYGSGIAGLRVPDFSVPTLNAGVPLLNTGTALNSATTMACHAGTVLWSDGGTHNIAKVGWRTGSTVTAGTGSTLRVSLQNIATSTPIKPDLTVDQSATYDPSTLATNTFYEATLSSVRSSVAHMDELAVVFDYSAYGSTTSIVIATINTSTIGANRTYGVSMSSNSGITWNASGTSTPLVVFISDDATPVYGRFATFPGFSAANTHSYNSTSDPKIYALSFTPPFDVEVTSIFRQSTMPETGDFEYGIWPANSATAIVSTAFDASKSCAATAAFNELPISPTTLTGGTRYHIGVKPTTNNNVIVYSFDLPSADYRKIWPWGTALAYATLSSADEWSAETTTRIPYIGMGISGIDTGGGSGGLAQAFGGVR